MGEGHNGTRTWKPLDEHSLVRRVKEGDPSAERALYDAHVDRVFRLAYRMTGDETLAQDFTQEAFIRAFNKLHTFRGDSALSTWMHTVTTSVVLNGLRKVKKFRTSEIDLEQALGTASGMGRAEPDLQDRLRQAVDSLPDGYRTVFVMHDIEGYTHDEIGSLAVNQHRHTAAGMSRITVTVTDGHDADGHVDRAFGVAEPTHTHRFAHPSRKTDQHAQVVDATHQPVWSEH